MAIYSLGAIIHARPKNVSPGEAVKLPTGIVQSLAVSPSDVCEPFNRTFEEVAAALSQLPRMFIEPDGSFVWVADVGPVSWQLDGMLYDRASRVLHVAVDGVCPRPEFDALLTTLGWPATSVIFQLTRAAVFVDEAEFRRFAAT